ncbi:ABC transporter permease [Brevibacillus sp. B_LB10_24]|uniref:ABC transporter permease n=1 Tax=Brevibacillus sp. B_LB10_24 TaxID=3380645 RepID=UPI0038B9C307
MQNVKRFWRKFSRNKGAVVSLFICLLYFLVAIFANVIAPYDYDGQNLLARLKPPSAEHWFGTDDFGRDVLSRVIVGAKVSVMIGFCSVAIAMLFGVPIGLIAGYNRRWDSVLMRLMDILLAFPGILLSMAVIAALGPSTFNVTLAVATFSIPTFARIVRSNVLGVKENEFIDAAKSYGLSNWKIVSKHILPNVMASIIVLGTMRFASGILTASSLSFLGLGVQPPTPDWGAMIDAGRYYMRVNWWLVAFPSAALFLLTMAVNVVGDGLRDALDPKM